MILKKYFVIGDRMFRELCLYERIEECCLGLRSIS